jgi:hypothetical protein
MRLLELFGRSAVPDKQQQTQQSPPHKRRDNHNEHHHHHLHHPRARPRLDRDATRAGNRRRPSPALVDAAVGLPLLHVQAGRRVSECYSISDAREGQRNGVQAAMLLSRAWTGPQVERQSMIWTRGDLFCNSASAAMSSDIANQHTHHHGSEPESGLSVQELQACRDGPLKALLRPTRGFIRPYEHQYPAAALYPPRRGIEMRQWLSMPKLWTLRLLISGRGSIAAFRLTRDEC